MKVVCDALGMARPSFYAWRRGSSVPGKRRRQSGCDNVPEETLLAAIKEARRAVLECVDRFNHQ